MQNPRYSMGSQVVPPRLRAAFAVLILCIASAALFCGSAHALSLPDDHDELFIIYKGELPVGFSYTTLTKKTVEGIDGPIWEIDSEIFIQFTLDGKPMETRQKSIELINSKLELVKLFKQSNIGATEYRLWAEKRGDTLSQTTRFSGKEYKKETPYPEGAVPLSVLAPVLAERGLDRIGSEPVRVISSSHTSVFETEDALSAAPGWEDFIYGDRTIQVKRIDSKLDDVATTYKIAADGNIYEAVQPTLNLIQKRIELADYYTIKGWLPWDIARAPMSDAAIKRVENPDKVTWLEVEIEWADSKPPAGTNLELIAAQQKLDKQTNSRDEGPKYFLRILRNPAKFSYPKQKKIPSVADFKKYLAADAMVQSDDPGILAAASRATGDATDTLSAATAIANWIYSNITPDPTSWHNQPAAAITLDSGIGMDKHAAVLFAAMARARNIRTRICSGRLYTMGLFVPHYWNEIYIDDAWLPVDATTADSQKYTVPLLIKLSHGATIEQAAAAAQRIDPKLIIKIRDYGYK